MGREAQLRVACNRGYSGRVQGGLEALRRALQSNRLCGQSYSGTSRTGEVHTHFEISPDPKDDPFCLCSEEGDADFIVTLNSKDFPQERLKAKVMSPVALA